MELLLLGTGSAAGRPAPFCACAACRDSVACGVARLPTGVLVDDAVLIDPSLAAAGVAARAGRDLSQVAVVLAGAGSRPTAASFAPDRWRHARPGATLHAGGRVIRALPAARPPAVAFDVTGADGGRLLYGPAGLALAGDALAAVAGAAFDLVVLDVFAAPALLGELRARGAVTEATRVLAAHLDHAAGPERVVRDRLARWGASAAHDGDLVTVGAATPALSGGGGPARTLVLGGARSGKSALAEETLLAEPAVRYVATSAPRPDDADWQARIAAHQRRRPAGWQTLETTELAPLLAEPGPPLLIDCLSLWLTAVLEQAGAFDEPTPAADADARVRRRVDELVAAWRQARGRVVAVSGEVGSGVVPATSSGRRFRDELGRLNARLAAESEHVLLTVAGQALTLR